MCKFRYSAIQTPLIFPPIVSMLLANRLLRYTTSIAGYSNHIPRGLLLVYAW